MASKYQKEKLRIQAAQMLDNMREKPGQEERLQQRAMNNDTVERMRQEDAARMAALRMAGSGRTTPSLPGANYTTSRALQNTGLQALARQAAQRQTNLDYANSLMSQLPEGSYQSVNDAKPVEKKQSFGQTLLNMFISTPTRMGDFSQENTAQIRQMDEEQRAGRSRVLQEQYGMPESEADRIAANWTHYQQANAVVEQDAYKKRRQEWLDNEGEEKVDLMRQLLSGRDSGYTGISQAFRSYDQGLRDKFYALGLDENSDEFKLLRQYVGEIMDEERTQTMQGDIRNFVDQYKAGGVVETLGGIGATLGAGPLAAVESLRALGYADKTAPINTNSPLYALQNYKNAAYGATGEEIREGIAERGAEKGLTAKEIEKKQNRATFAYNVATSTAESAMLAYIGKGVAKAAQAAGLSEGIVKALPDLVTLPIFSTSAYSQTVQDAQARGISRDKAVLTGVFAGVAESLFEKMSLDAFYAKYAASSAGKIGLKKTITNLLSQSGIEGSEEVFTEIANILSDAIINQDYSELMTRRHELIADGKSEQEAERIVLGELISQIGESGLAGAISGGIMGGLATGTGQINYHNTAKAVKTNAELTDKILETAKTQMDEDSTARQIAEEKTSETITDKELSQVLQSMTEVANAQEEEGGIENLLAKEFESLGESEEQAAQDAKRIMEIAFTEEEDITDESEAALSEEMEQNENLAPVMGQYLRGETGGVINAVNAVNAEMKLQSQQREAQRQAEKEQRQIERQIRRSSINNMAQVTTDDGKQGIAVRFESVEPGQTPTVRMGDGSVLSMDKFTANDHLQTELWQDAAKLEDTAAANAFLEDFNGNTLAELKAYNLASYEVYAMGRVGALSFDEVMNDQDIKYYATSIDPAHLRTMYDLGANAAKASNAEEAPARLNQKAEGLGTVTDNRSNASEDVSYKLAEVVAEKTGANITLKDSVGKDTNGSFVASFGRIAIGSESGNEYGTLVHEMSEFGRAYSPKKMQLVIDKTMQYVQSQEGVEALTVLLENYKKTYRALESGKTIEQSADEFTFDYVAGLMMTEEGQKDFQKWLSKNATKSEKRSIAQTLADIFDKVVEMIQKILDTAHLNPATRQALRAEEKAAKEIRDLWFEALDEASENMKSQAKSEQKTEEESEELPVQKQFSMKLPVEQTKNLIAVHNLSPEKLMGVLELGGFPMASIAVTRADLLHSRFGAVSVLFFKDTIDPKLTKANRVYSADAYTPTFPRVGYKVNDTKLREIIKRLRNILGDDVKAFDYLALDHDNASDYIDRNNGDAAAAYANKDAIMYAYAKDKGIDFKAPMREVQLTWDYDNELVKIISQMFTPEEVLKVRQEASESYKEFIEDGRMQKILKKVNAWEKKTYGKLYEKHHSTEITFSEFDHLMMAVAKYNREGIQEEVDRAEFAKKIKEVLEGREDDYKAWLNELFDGVVEKRGIRNSKDPFTPSGSRRSWDTLYDEYTLENIVKAMKDRPEVGQGILGYTLFGSVNRSFDSIEDIHTEEGRLQNIDDDAYDKMRTEIQNDLYALAQKLAPNPGYDTLSICADISEAAAKRKTRSGIKSFLSQWYKVSESDMDEIMRIIDAAKNLPTGYFEAKPRRAIGLDEIARVILPSDAEQELLDALDAKNVPYAKYQAGDKEDRLRVLNEVADEEEDVRFSLNVSVEEELASYGKYNLNDYISVQKAVYNTLKAEGYFVAGGREIVNENTGKIIVLNRESIRETFGTGTKFQTIPRELKELKVATVRYLPDIIREGQLRAENVENYHNGEKGVYDYYSTPVIINGIPATVRFSVKKTSKNKFWIHHVDIVKGYKNAPDRLNLPTNNEGHILANQGTDTSVSDSSEMSSRIQGYDIRENATPEQIQDSDILTRFSLRVDNPPKKTKKAYKVFVAFENDPGHLYPPMVASPGGAPTAVGVWLDADTGEIARNADGSIVVNSKGRIQVKQGGKGTNKSSGGTLAWRPGWHLGEYPDAKQFAVKNPETGELKSMFPANFIFAECEIAADEDYQIEAMSYGVSEKGKFNRSQAGLPYIPKDGYYKYRTNPDPSTAPWYITGSMKVTRILDDAEVRKVCAEYGVTPLPRLGGDIDLAKYGFKAGKVKSSGTEGIPSHADYSDEIRNLPGYVQRELDFDDPNVRKEFEINGLNPEDYRYSMAVHAGDLGKAEGFWNMVSSRRSTGHFGTGTYFVGDEEQINDYGYEKRPHEKVDFDRYNLFAPKNYRQAMDLHEALKFINNNVYMSDVLLDSAKVVRDMADLESFGYDLYKDRNVDAAIERLKEIYDKYAKYLDSYDRRRFEEREKRLDDRDYLIDFLIDFSDMKGDIEEAIRDYNESFNENLARLSAVLGVDEDKVWETMVDVWEESAAIEDAYQARYEDSPSTRFMKRLGYEGVDVRHIKEMDNVQYGSVIYDLKGEDLKRKQEIGTARYSMNVTEDSEGRTLAPGQQNFFAKSLVRDSKGRLKVMYHGTPRGGFNIFEFSDDGISFFFTDKLSAAGTYSGVPYAESHNTPMTLDQLNEALWNTGGSSDEDEYFTKNGEKYEYWEIMYGKMTLMHTFDSLQEAQNYFIDKRVEPLAYQGDGSPMNYEVYLNVANPLVVDAMGGEWNAIPRSDFAKHFENIEISENGDGTYSVNYKEVKDWQTPSKFHRGVTMTEAELKETFGYGIEESLQSHAAGKNLSGITMIVDLYLDENGHRLPSTTREYAKYAKDNGYDGVMFNNIIDSGFYDQPDIKSNVVVVFEPNQIKSIYNLNPTENPDIRYSMSVWDDEIDSELQKDLDEANSILRQGFESLGDLEIDKKTIDRVADSIKRDYKTTMSKKDIADRISRVFAYLQDTGSSSKNDLMRIMREVAEPIMEEMEPDPALVQTYKDFRDYFKGKRIRLSSEQAEEVRHIYGSSQAFRNAMWGNGIIIAKDGVPLDSLWNEICDQAGGHLDYGENTGNMPIALADFMKALKPGMMSYKDMGLENAPYDLALDIYRRYFEERAKIDGADATIKAEAQKIAAKQQEFLKKQVDKYKKSYQDAMKDLEKAKQMNIDRLAQEIAEIADEEKVASLEGNMINEALLKAERLRYEERLQDLRDQKNEKIALVKAKAEVARRRQIESRRLTEYKTILRKQIDELNAMLAHPTEAKHIPVDMVNAVISVLESVNVDTGSNQSTRQKLDRLAALYEKYRNNESVMMDYDERTAGYIQRLKEIFNGRNYTQLYSNELWEVNDILRAIKTQIRNANKLLGIEKHKYAREASKTAIKEVEESKKVGGTLANMLDTYATAHLNSRRFFRKIFGYRDGAGMALWQQLDDGQQKMMNIQRTISGMFQDVVEGKENQKRVRDLISTKPEDLVDVGLTDENGLPVKVSKAMRLSLLMHVQSPSNMRHILRGGLTVPDMELFSKNIQEAYARGKTYQFVDTMALLEAAKNGDLARVERLLGEAEQKIKDLRKDLSPWELAYLKDAEEMFHDYTGELINETSIALKGYAIARVKDYFPIRTDASFVKQDFSGLVQDASLEGMGMLKERVVSSKPILLEDITNVIARQTKNVSMYAGMAVPLRNLNMVLNHTFIDENGHLRSLKQAIKNTWGANNEKYLQDLMQDVQGGRSQDNSPLGHFMDQLRGNYAGAVLTLNPSVAIKQSASYPTAAAIVGWKPLLRAIKDVGKGFVKGEGLAELEKRNPLLWYRGQGYASQEMADAKRSGLMSKLPKALKWVEFMDIGTVRTLEYAAKYYVDEQGVYKEGTDAYWNEVSRVFTRIVEETQPNYTPLQQAGIIRNPNKFLKQIIMFKTQPLQNFSIVYDAVMDLNAQMRYAKEGKGADVDGAKKNLAKAISAYTVASMVFSAMTILAGLLLHKHFRYKDDEGEMSAEEIAKAFGQGILDNFLGSFIFGGELYEALEAVLTGEYYYGIDASTLETINNIVKNTEYEWKYLQRFANDALSGSTESDFETDLFQTKKYGWKILENVATFAGIPLGNVKKIYDSIELSIQDAVNGEPWGTTESPTADDISNQYERMMEALVAGDAKRYDELYDEQVEYGGKTEDTIDQQIRSKITSLLKSGEITGAEAVRMYETAGMSAEDAENKVQSFYKDSIKEGFKDGSLSESEAMEGLVDNGMSESDAYFQVQQWESGSSSDYGAIYSSIDNAIGSGTEANRQAMGDEIRGAIDHGKDGKTIAKQITSKYKSDYLNALASGRAADMKNILITAFMYCGLSRDEAVKKIDGWEK